MNKTPPDFQKNYYGAFCLEAEEDVDDIDIMSVKAFTWTPDPAKYPSYIPRKQYKSLLKHVLLTAYKYFSKFVFIPELNENGNVHIHGWFIIKNRIGFYKNFLPKCKEYGYTLVKDKYHDKSIDKGWFDYCSEEIEETVSIVGKDLPIPLTHINYECYKKLWSHKSGIKNVKRHPVMKSVLEYFK